MKKGNDTPKKKDPPKQHQDYDNILKKSFTRIYQSLIHKLLGLDVKDTVKIPTSFSRTKEKRSDFAVKVSPPNKEPHIVHVEFQSDNDKNMDKRELGYYNDYYWEYNLEIVQYVIYMGMGNSTMPTEIKHKNLTFRYEIIVMNQIDVDLFLNSDQPHEIVLAVLCKYTRRQAPKIIKQILEKLKAQVPNERELHEHVTDLEILSGMRNLQPEIKKQIEKMPIIYDLRKDLRFQEGSEDRARASAIRMLKESVPVKNIAAFLDIPLAFVLDIQKELQEKPKLKSRTKQAN